jgi:hypothetical protein
MIIKLTYRGPLFDHDNGAVWRVVDGIELAARFFVYGGNCRPERFYYPIMLAGGGTEVRG